MSECGGCSSAQMTKEDFLEIPNKLSNVKKVIGVVSGKGGVGKSSVTSMLSVLMNKKGYKTAVLDADITGPSIPKAFNVHIKAAGTANGIIPVETKTGIKIMSINLLLENETDPVVWRGPVIAGVVKQFWTDVCWGDVDYMFVDMPPGTGDVPLTVFQSLPLDGIIVVTSPQDLVSMIVAKAVEMAKMMEVPVLGLVENYSYARCPDCGKKIYVFGESNIKEIAAQYGIKALANVPIDPKVAKACDKGKIEDIDANYLESVIPELEAIKAKKRICHRNNMVVAIPTDEGNLSGHFGKCTKFTIAKIENGGVVSEEILDTKEAKHEALAGILKEKGVELAIAGNIGEGAKAALQSEGILLIAGASGSIPEVIAGFITGDLKNNPNVGCDHHSEGGSCGGGSCGGCCH